MNDNACKIIDALGGTFAVAKLCQIKPPSVSEWRRQGIPKAREMFLKAVHPEVFGLSRKRRKPIKQEA